MTHAEMTVRMATPADEDGIFALCRMQHSESGLFSLSEMKTRSIIHDAIHPNDVAPPLAWIGVIGEPGRLEASICLKLSQLYYTDDWHLTDLWALVHPDYRKPVKGESRLQKLICFAKDCATRMNKEYLASVITDDANMGKAKMFERQLGAPIGSFFIYPHRGVHLNG